MKRKSQYIKSLATVFLLSLCAGCSQDSSLDSGSNKGNAGEIHFFVEGIEGSSENDMTTRSLAGSETPIIFVKKLNNGYTLTGTLETEPESRVLSRAGLKPLDSGTKYCIVAYKDGGDKENDSRQGICSVDGISKLTLPPGTYQLYAYSYNSRTDIDTLSGDNLKNIRMPYKEDTSKELLYYKVPQEVTVAVDGSVTNSEISIKFSRKTSKLTVKLDGEASQTSITGGGLSIIPYRHGSFDASLNQPTWNASTIVDESGDLPLPDFTLAASYKAISTCYIIPKNNDTRTVKLKDISIGTSNDKKSVDLPLKYSFEAGYQYTMKIKVTPPGFSEDIDIDGVQWARSNSRTIGMSSNGTTFHDYSFQFTGISASYWGYFTIRPSAGTAHGFYQSRDVNWNEYRTYNSGDAFACPTGYRLPTKTEFENLLSKPHYSGKYGTYVTLDGETRDVYGMFFNTSTEPIPGTESKFLFLPYTGRYMDHVNSSSRPVLERDYVGYYWTCNGGYIHEEFRSPDQEDTLLGSSLTSLTDWKAYCAVLKREGDASIVLKYCVDKKRCAIRCVKE